MTDFREQIEVEERYVPLGCEDQYYSTLYPYSFKLKVNTGERRLGEAHEWCGSHWGAPAARRYSNQMGGWRVRDDSCWAYYLNLFYFKEETDCVLFQIRWR